MQDLGAHFGWVNWAILLVVFFGTTAMAHFLKGSRAGMRGFFLGNRSLPFWAVGGSLIATRTSALVFIAIPAAVFKPGGDLTYLQMTLGYVIGDVVMALFFIKYYYEKEIYSPYEFMEERLGPRVGQLTRVLWMIGAILSQGVRLLATSLVLSVITGLSLGVCILLIGAFSIVWSILGGITTVVWTDFLQLCIFTLGALFSIYWVLQSVSGGWSETLEAAREQSKLTLFNFSLDPRATYTLWVALIPVAVFQLSQLTIDQVFVQRTLCCKSVGEARKSIYFALLGNLTTILMAAVGIGLFAYYQTNPLQGGAAELIAKDPDKVFPYFIVTRIPAGVSGLIIASIFAAGISTLDSGLAALSEASVNGVYRKYFRSKSDEAHYMKAAKFLIAFWGVLLCLAAYGFYILNSQGLLELGLSVYGYVYGALFGIALLAFCNRGSWGGILAGTILSAAAVIALSLLKVSFFWWYPAGALILIGVALPMSSRSSEVTDPVAG